MNQIEPDRFVLEAQIHNCWNVVDDLKLMLDSDQVTVENMQAMAKIYQLKFNALYNTFERLVESGKIV